MPSTILAHIYLAFARCHRHKHTKCFHNCNKCTHMFYFTFVPLDDDVASNIESDVTMSSLNVIQALPRKKVKNEDDLEEKFKLIKQSKHTHAIFSINISFFLYPALLVRHAVYLCILPNRLRGFQKEQKHFLYAGKIRRIAKKKQYKIGKTLSHDFRASVQLLSIIKLLIFFSFVVRILERKCGHVVNRHQR